MCFSSVFDRVQHYLKIDEVVLVKGEVELRGGTVKLLARDIVPMWKVREQMVKSIILQVRPGQLTVDAVGVLKQLCDAHRGHCRLYFDVHDPDLPGGVQRIRSRTTVVDPTPVFMRDLARLVGRDNVVLEGGD